MTSTLRRPRAEDDVRDNARFWPVLTATAGIAIVAAFSSPPAWFSTAVVVVGVVALGIPHGAIDHLVVEAIDGGRDSSSRWRFVRNYVLAMVGVGLVWVAAPPVALALFIALSVHHFGQSDLAYLRLPGSKQLVLQWSRGLFLVGVPLVAHLPTVSPIIERLGGGDPMAWPWLANLRWLWCPVLVIQHVVVGAAVSPRIAERAVVGRETLTVAVLTLLFLAADPLIGFAVYFALWHSLGHLQVLAGLLGDEERPMRSVVRFAAPLTAVSIAGLAAVAGAAASSGRADLLVPVIFVFVSMVTVPHMVVVERLWRRPTTR